MSIEENKATVRRVIEEGWNQGNIAVLDELCAPNWVFQLGLIPAPGQAS